ncbi:flagellar filament capping protein FliD [Sphingomonas japonica]|uniref:Flagellar hook-associated protein 2 n=1 Tax=Sphingomonas japonica TaxID=511662 RepID=A0ABX0U003_9SPHN|nr:flagellar filament capping protein FliD [Sphingomonas japonica]NIJ23818.1 flagellar hook-associated protein 2 [Sphingomonas japonica]
MVDSITQTLGSGSGINISELVGSLVDAQYAVKNETLTQRSEALAAQISGVSTLKSGISGFASALASLVSGGSLATQPTSSNESVVKVSKLAGGSAGALNSTIEVRQIAAIQSASTAPIADRTAVVGKGMLTLQFGTATVADGAMTGFAAGSAAAIDIVIDDSNSTLDGIARAINAKGAGVTASILSDADGARLVLKGATGESQAFTLSATEDGSAPGLSALTVGVGASGTTIGSAARDAIVAVDGVALKRASNSINNLIDGVKIDLVTAQPGTMIALGSSAPTANLRQAVTDVVTTYNELLAMVKEQTNSISGALRSDPAAQTMLRSMRALTLTELIPAGADGAPTNLAEIGVTTNRDGTLSVDTGKLAKVLANHPGSVEAMFAPGSSGASEKGLSAALNAISAQVTSTKFGLGASEARYTKAQSLLVDQQLKASDAAEVMRTRLTQQFASMDAKVAAYKSTQTFLEQQIDAWNSQN